MIKNLNCYYLKNKMRNMSSCRDSARALIYFDQDILTLLVCEDFIVTFLLFKYFDFLLIETIFASTFI